MSTRRLGHPPDAPLTSSGPPAVSPALGKGTGTQSIAMRLRFWRALAGFLLADAATVYGAWKALGAGWPAGDVLFWAGVVFAVASLGAVWVGLTLLQDVSQLAFMWRLWAVQLGAVAGFWHALSAGMGHYAHTWYKAPAPDPALVINGRAAGSAVAPTVDAQARAAVAELNATVERVLARVSPPPASSAADADTRHLADRQLLAAAYYGGPAARIVATALRREAISHAALTPAFMSSDQWRQATALLGQAGVLTGGGERRPWRLAGDLAALSEEAAHTAAVDRLVAVGVTPSELPGDMAQ